MFKAVSSVVKVKVDLKPVVDNLVFKLHYRYTYIFFLVATALATLYDVIGESSTICIHFFNLFLLLVLYTPGLPCLQFI